MGATDKEADRVLAEIESGTADGALLKGAFTRLTMAQRNFSRTSILAPARMTSYLADAVEALSRMQISRASMMLAVVRVSTLKEPGLWGVQDSPTSLGSAIAKLQEKLEAAYARIEAALRLDDFTIHADFATQDRENGMSLLTFKTTGDQVRLGDGRDIGPRLVGWWQQHGSSKKKAAA